MRLARLLPLATAAALTVSLTACGNDPTSTSTPTRGGISSASSSVPAPSGAAPNVTVTVPPTPVGKWVAAGNLCKLLEPVKAAGALGHSGRVTATFSKNMLPVNGGIDACTYMDETAPGYSANLVVLKATPSLGETTREQLTRGNYPIQKFNVPGADDAFFAHDQAIVIQGGVMAAVNNSSGGRFAPAGLIRLAALAATITS